MLRVKNFPRDRQDTDGIGQVPRQGSRSVAAARLPTRSTYPNFGCLGIAIRSGKFTVAHKLTLFFLLLAV